MFELPLRICVFMLISLSLDSALGQVCEPEFKANDDVLHEPAELILTCKTRDRPTCTNSTEYILYQKYFDIWYTVAIINSSDHLTTTKLPNGYSISDRTEAAKVSNKYRLGINPAQIEDSGNWRCAVQDNNGDIHNSTTMEAKLARTLTKGDIEITVPPEIVLGSAASYMCRSDRVYPKATVGWIINENPESGSTHFIPDGIAFNISSNVSYTFTNRNIIDVNCTFGREDLNSPVMATAGDVADIHAPAFIENNTLPNSTPILADILQLSCTASGTNAKINWLHKGDPVNMSLFMQYVVNVTGDFQFGEKTAKNSTLTWITPSRSTCENVAAHNGEYTCTAQADRGGQVSQNVGTVDVRYSPISLNEPSCDINATVGDIVQIDVKTCSNPTATYTWTSKDGHHDVSAQNGESVEFRVQENDTIICNVSNRYDNLVAYCIIFAIESEDATTPGVTTTVDPGKPKGPNQALVTAFAVIWSLCGMFAILLVCLALYHYRQIQNGKKYQGEFSEEIVLTEDEAKPGTSHGSGEYDDINPGVVGKGSVSGEIGGETNEGLYAEVKTPAHTQMHVAPEGASKVQASQTNQSTLTTKRTQAPTAPMKVRQQPYSPSNYRLPEPTADYSPERERRDISPQHSNISNHGRASKAKHQQKRHESQIRTAAIKQNTNGAKPSIPFKPNITSFRSSSSSCPNPTGTPCDNAEANVYANCDQRPVPKNDDDIITYADLALPQEDPYDEGAPPVPKKHMNDKEPVQYASIKHTK